MEIRKAQRSQSKIKIAITGPSGSGKTYSSLCLASGLGKKICLIDTENNSASLYSDQFDFDVIDLKPPYSIERYLEALKLATDSNYDVVIADSISHAWAGEGGLLQRKEQLDARGGSGYTNWAKMTPLQERFVSALVHAPVHLIVTIRSKTAYELIDDNGKKKPVKLGLAPIQRDGIEYEFTTVFDVAQNHEAAVSKDRSGIFNDRIFKISKETGLELANWLNSETKELPKVLASNKDKLERSLKESTPQINLIKWISALKNVELIKNCLEEATGFLEESNTVTSKDLLALDSDTASKLLEHLKLYFINKGI